MKNKLIYVFVFSSALLLLCTQMYASGAATGPEWFNCDLPVHCASGTIGGKTVEFRSAEGISPAFVERHATRVVVTSEDGSVRIARAFLTREYTGADSEEIELSDKTTGKRFLFVFGIVPSDPADLSVGKLSVHGLTDDDGAYAAHEVAYILTNDKSSHIRAIARTKGLAATAAAIVAQLTE